MEELPPKQWWRDWPMRKVVHRLQAYAGLRASTVELLECHHWIRTYGRRSAERRRCQWCKLAADVKRALQVPVK